MSGFFVDFIIVSLLIIGGIAFMGSILAGVGNMLGSKTNRFTGKTADMNKGWNKVGGTNNN